MRQDWALLVSYVLRCEKMGEIENDVLPSQYKC